MSFSVDVLAKIAIDLQSGIGHQDRFQRLISTLRHVLGDASALLRYEGRQFIPLAIDGLAQDVLGRRFTLEGHPRLEAIARAGDVVRFPADSDLPDPYDGLIPGQESLKVHACIGLPLFAGQNLIGALTLDGMSPDQFDSFSDEELRLIAALAAGALNNALLIEQLESQNILPGSPAAFEQVTHTEMIGLSPGMAQLKKEIEIVAASDLNVLIFGETGTGKELVAKSIHEASPRAVNPLVYLNCAALPESVAESELFGHVKGAFTGAISNRSGKFEMADNGTLFLDEIGELSLALQAKLLRVLQYGDIQRVGMTAACGWMCACWRRPTAICVKRCWPGVSRRPVPPPERVPASVPLRERGEDVVLLAGYFCEQCRLRMGLSRVVLSPGRGRIC
jgi:anaerobic nitric oxide reductase transcription regulator